MPYDHSDAGPKQAETSLDGTGFEAFADLPGAEPPPVRWVRQGGFGYREEPPGRDVEGAELLRAMIRSLGARRLSRQTKDPSRTE
jgi:hypothetical protein